MPTTSPSDPVTVLDGGLSTALEGLGADLGSSLWTARLLSEDPGLLVAATGLPAVAYPNKGGSWDSATRTWEGATGLELASVRAWVEAGARYVGGCCGTGPADIEALSRAVSA